MSLTSRCAHGYNLRMTQLPPILTASEVAALFRVDPRTVGRWADAGTLIHTRTPGGKAGRGHRRYPSAQPLIQQHLAVLAAAAGAASED